MTYGHTGMENSRIHVPQPHQIHQIQGTHMSQSLTPDGTNPGSLHQQTSFSSSEEERSTPECGSDEPDESEKGKSYTINHKNIKKKTIGKKINKYPLNIYLPLVIK